MSIIREHGGNIEAEILPGGGSAFTIYLPSAPVETPSTASETMRPAAELLKGRGVLVLDDEESLRMLLQEGLTVNGLRVDCAATIDEALAHFGRSSYDVLLCDLHLSANGFAVDGREAAPLLLQAAGAQKPAVIFMTGDLIESSAQSSGRGGPFWLQKPFRVSDVLALLRDVLSGAPAETHPNR